MMGWPIWTAVPAMSLVLVSISMLEKVAPRKPSRPVRPPSATIKSPALDWVGLLPWGKIPKQPQKTSGLAVYPSWYKIAPFTVGMPILLP